MEIVRRPSETREFHWQDVTFFIRSRATAQDRFEIDMLYDVDKEGVSIVPRKQIYKTLIERFVVKWKGVKSEGADVPFSWDALMSLPMHVSEDVVLLLGSNILNNSGLFETPKEKEQKKG